MYYNIYFSPTGGTQRVADIIASNLCDEYCDVDICRDIDNMTLTELDICIVSVPSYSGRVPAIAIERIRKIKANGAKAILNCVYGNREWEDTLTELQDTLEGNHGTYKEVSKGGPFKPEANENCIACGACANGCPVNAIDNTNPRKTNKEICISCMRCVGICPVHARDFDVDFMKEMSEKMAPKLGGHKENHLFL